MKDMRGVEIQEGNVIIYGKSCRYTPVNLGTVVRINEDSIDVLGKGNVKTGNLREWATEERVLVLPEDYLDS